MKASNSAFLPSQIRAELTVGAAVCGHENAAGTSIVAAVTSPTRASIVQRLLIVSFSVCIYHCARGSTPRAPCPLSLFPLLNLPQIQRHLVPARTHELIDRVGRPVPSHAERMRHDSGARLELTGQHGPQPFVRRRDKVERDDGG